MSRYQEKSPIGAKNTRRLTSAPRETASAAALAPRECATIACAGPCVRTKARTASAHSTIVVRPGARSPGSESLWLGRSNAITRCPASTRGLTKTPRCARQPPHPWTRYTVGPAPQDSPAILCPDQVASTGSLGGTPGGIRKLISTAGGVHQSSVAHLDPRAGANRSSSPSARRTFRSIGGSTPEPASSPGNPDSPAISISPLRPRRILLMGNIPCEDGLAV